MTISQYKEMLSRYQGCIRIPEDFEQTWKQASEHPILSVARTPVPFCNDGAVYETMTVTCDGGEIKARVIRPAAEGRHPMVLMFHDLGRGIRGWHHMTRFLAMGFGVIALDAEPFAGDWKSAPEAVGFARRYRDALILTKCALELPFADPDRLVTWGEGFGGGLAIVSASILPESAKCIALNPFPADIRSVCGHAGEEVLSSLDHVDLANFAPGLRARSLFGVCLMDEIAKPEGQFAILNHLSCPFRLKIYPKYAHERVNFFENEILNFLRE